MIRAIAFDLDDTLLDTTHLLVPAAALEACQAMKSAGLACTLEECLQWREQMAPHHSHRDIFRLIAEKSQSENVERLSQLGIQRFYNPTVPEKLPLLAGAEQVLQNTISRYALYLVTSGVPETQMKKIKSAGLPSFFRHCYAVDGFAGATKRQAFEDICRRESIQPSQLLSVGNRLSQEIRQAKQLGAMTCYFKYGEHVGEQPQQTEDHADFTVESWSEFLNECRL